MKTFDIVDLTKELKKYNPEYGEFFRNWILDNFNVIDTIDQYLSMKKN